VVERHRLGQRGTHRRAHDVRDLPAGQKAFMQGKVKISGKMLKMMQLRGPLEKVQAALNTIDTEY
jgi:SCP-2 sterol transfer family